MTLVVKTYPLDKEITVKIGPQDTLSEVKQRLIEVNGSASPFTNYSFALADKKDEKLSFYEPVGEFLQDNSKLIVVPNKYTTAESIQHVMSTRVALGFDLEQANNNGIESGSSMFGHLVNSIETADSNKHIEEEEIDESKLSEEEIKVEQQKRFKNRPRIVEHPLSEDLDYRLSTAVTAQPQPQLQNAVRSLQLSQWNPVPHSLKMKGHLLYLQVNTLEGKSYHITSCTNGYFVSNCSGEKFDPYPRKNSTTTYPCLLTLLKTLSPQIEKVLAKNVELIKSIETLMLTNPTNSFLANPWIVKESKDINIPDLARTQDKLDLSNTNELRDWNEELQSARELTVESGDFTGKITRERLLNKVSFDFAQVAVKAAKDIVHGDMTPLNPLEPKDSHIFMQNGMFFSYAADGIGTFENEGGDSAARIAASKDVAGVNYINQLDIEGLCQLCTVVVDYCGHRVVCQGPVPGIFRENPETQQIVYGSVEQRESIEKNEGFEKYMQAIADACHLKSHMAYDRDGKNGKELVTAFETKGLEGTDGRNYVLDLYRIAPSDLSFIEENCDSSETSYPHRMGVLRTEAIDEWFRSKVREYLAEKNESEQEDDKEKEKSEEELQKIRTEQQEAIKELQQKHRLNPDVAIDINTLPTEAHEQFKKDQEEVREVCKLITSQFIPSFLDDLTNYVISSPLDGAHLTQLMHRRGINMRYIGALYTAAKERKDNKLDFLCELLKREAISRTIKHVWNSLVKNVEIDELSAFAARFFNLLFLNKGQVGEEGILESGEKLRAYITTQVEARFRLKLESNWMQVMDSTPLFREVSKKVGLQWKSRDYVLSTDDESAVAAAAASDASSKKQQKKDLTRFNNDDLLNVVPMVKASTFKSQLAEDAMEAGRMAVLRGERETGISLLFEALSLYEQIYGLMSSYTGHAYSLAATSYHDMKEYSMSCELSRKATVILEKTTGHDSHETLYSLLNLATHEQQNNNHIGVFTILRHTLQLWRIVSGTENHPDSISTLLNLSWGLSYVKDEQGALNWRKKAMEMAKQVSNEPEGSLLEGQIAYYMSEPLCLINEWEEAVEKTKFALKIYESKLGEDNEQVSHLKKWLEMIEPAAKQYKEQAKNNTNNNNNQQKISNATLQAAHHNSRLRRQHERYMNLTSQNEQQQSKLNKVDNLDTKRRLQNADKSIDELINYIDGAAGTSQKKNKKKSKASKK